MEYFDNRQDEANEAMEWAREALGEHATGNETTDAHPCPKCGENRIDWLIWDEEGYDSQLECASCGTVYVAA